MLLHFVVYFLLGGGRSGSFWGVGGSLVEFGYDQHEQIPIALSFERLHDRHRLTEQSIALRGAGLRRECVFDHGVPTGLRAPATLPVGKVLVVDVGQLRHVPKHGFSKPKYMCGVHLHSGSQVADALPEIKPPLCQLLRRLLLTPIPCTQDAPLISIAQGRRPHPFRTCNVRPFRSLSLERLFLSAIQPVQAVLRFTYRVLGGDILAIRGKTGVTVKAFSNTGSLSISSTEACSHRQSYTQQCRCCTDTKAHADASTDSASHVTITQRAAPKRGTAVEQTVERAPRMCA